MVVDGMVSVPVQFLVLMVLVYGKNISQEWPSFSHYILYDIGDGLRVKFWHNYWCGETPLVVSYPKLFRFCRDKEASVAKLIFTNGVFGI